MLSEVRVTVSADHDRSLRRTRRSPLELTSDLLSSDFISEILWVWISSRDISRNASLRSVTYDCGSQGAQVTSLPRSALLLRRLIIK